MLRLLGTSLALALVFGSVGPLCAQHLGGDSLPPMQQTAPLPKARAMRLVGMHSEAAALYAGAIAENPQIPQLHEAYLDALAAQGQLAPLMSAWREYRDVHEPSDQAIETVAWGLLRDGARSPSVMVRYYALLAAFFSRDAYGVQLVRSAYNDRQAQLRGLAAQLTAQLRDRMLVDGLLKLLRTDPDYSVRLAAMQAAGTIGIPEARGDLEALLDSPRSKLAERAVAAQALSALHDDVRVEDLKLLAQSPRRGLRLLSAYLAVQFATQSAEEALVPLLEDQVPDVRATAAAALALGPARKLLQPLLSDSNPTSACLAAWAVHPEQPEAALKTLEHWLQQPARSARLLAVAALAACGSSAAPQLSHLLTEHQDPYVRLNAAIGLLRLQESTARAAAELERALSELPEAWAWKRPTLFGSLLAYIAPAAGRSGQETDFFVRLDVLSMLAIEERPSARLALRETLRGRRWGFAGAAAQTLLSEGEHSSPDLLRELLGDLDPHVRLQAALVLAFWGKDPEALNTLQDSYPSAERFLKERILEGLGFIGSRSAVPFLLDRLEDPHPTLRLIAASSLLTIINH